MAKIQSFLGKELRPPRLSGNAFTFFLKVLKLKPWETSESPGGLSSFPGKLYIYIYIYIYLYLSVSL